MHNNSLIAIAGQRSVRTSCYYRGVALCGKPMMHQHTHTFQEFFFVIEQCMFCLLYKYYHPCSFVLQCFINLSELFTTFGIIDKEEREEGLKEIRVKTYFIFEGD